MAKIFNQRGQLILMALVMLGGAIFAAVGIVGYFTRLQVRQATNVVHSTMAIYAADAGMEKSQFIFWRCYVASPSSDLAKCFRDASFGDSSNGVTISVSARQKIPGDSNSEYLVTSTGEFLDTFRTLELTSMRQ